MKQWLRSHSKFAVFCCSVAAQSAMHLPFLFAFSFCKCFLSDTSASLAMMASMITGFATILMLEIYFEKWANNVTYWLPLSFLVHHRILVMIHSATLEYHRFINLPYEWEKYTKIIGDLYACPFAVITLILTFVYRCQVKRNDP